MSVENELQKYRKPCKVLNGYCYFPYCCESDCCCEWEGNIEECPEYKHHNSKRETEFVINEHLTLRLVDNKTKIFVDNQEFKQCTHLVLSVPIVENNNYNSIDELEKFSSFKHAYEIDPDTEFIGHCSNLQAWYENNYNTMILHRNIAFPLLKKLSEVGDQIAKKVFKEEIVSRLESGFGSVIRYLIQQGFLDVFTLEELISIEHLFREYKLEYIICLYKKFALSELPDKFRNEVISRVKRSNTLIKKKLLRENYLNTLSIEDIVSIEPFVLKKCRSEYISFLYRYFYKIYDYKTEEERDNYIIKLIDKGTEDILMTLVSCRHFETFSLYNLIKKREDILRKLTIPEFRADFLQFIKKRTKINRELSFDNNLYGSFFDDPTQTFRHSFNHIIARQFDQVNHRSIRAIRFIANSKKSCSKCSNKAGFSISFSTGLKLFSKYYCESCLMERFDNMINGFKQIKKKVMELG